MERLVPIDLRWGRSDTEGAPHERGTSDASSPVDRAPVARSACLAGIRRLLADAPGALLRDAAGRWSSRPRAARPAGGRWQHERSARLSQLARLPGLWPEPRPQLPPPAPPPPPHSAPHPTVLPA